MKTKSMFRWMAIFATETAARPAWLPSDAVVVRLSDGGPATPVAPGPGSEPTAAKIPAPDTGGERGNTA